MSERKKCKTKGCRRTVLANRTVCWKCKKETHKKNDPYSYHYQILKGNAKRRGKEFTITLEDFKAFCYETQILHGRGRTSTALHIDRIDDEKGYVPGNLQPMTNTDNMKKEWERRRKKVVTYDYLLDYGRVLPLHTLAPPHPDCPF